MSVLRFPMLSAFLGLTMLAPVASAQSAPLPVTAPYEERAGESAPATPAETVWYGWQLLIMDGASVALIGGDALVVARAASGDPTVTPGGAALILAPGAVGALGYLLGGPTIHWVHGRAGTGFLSLGLRVVAPLAGLGIGAIIPGVAGYDNTIGALIGGIAGVGAAVVLDAALLAREKVVTQKSAKTSFFSMTPTFDGKHRGAGLKVSGTF